LLAAALLPFGCGPAAPPKSLPPVAAAPAATAPTVVEVPLRMEDVTKAAGISFVHENGARGERLLPETMGSGVALFDADSDGRLDIYFANSRAWGGKDKGPPPTGALYKNLGNWHFQDVTKASGLAVPLFGMGVATGDMDNDGDQDLFVACLGPDKLFRNDGGKFTDVSHAAGLAEDQDFGSSATWLDADGDGHLDLLVANYVTWTRDKDIDCTLDGVHESYCTPESYDGASPRLWHNKGDGTFEDRTVAAGLEKKTAKALGVVVGDLDDDGIVDIVIANDTQPNYVFRGKGDGTFEEVGVRSGIAFSEGGVARAGMGVDLSDFDGNGRLDLVIGNFSNEMVGLYRNEGHALFVDASPGSGVGRATLATLAFGCAFLDVDLDGREDLVVADGHIEPDIERVQARVTYAEPPHLFLNVGSGKMVEITKDVGDAFAAPQVARGVATGDLDGDGDLDIVFTQNGGAARVFRNDLLQPRHWLRVALRGTAPRDAIGAVVRLTCGGATQVRPVRGGSAYLSQSARALTFGLGSATTVEKLEVRWPSGAVTQHAVEGIDREIVIQQPS
jgi:hypothetical protein